MHLKHNITPSGFTKINSFSNIPAKSTERILYMKTLFLSSLIVFCILIAYENRKHKKIIDKQEKDFWEKESQANSTRKKSLADLPYITIPFDILPMQTLSDLPRIMEISQLLHNLSSQKIVNMTGFTNTELKLTYGAANITCLSEYDQNYTLLVRTLQEWAEFLHKNECDAEAKQVLEYAISINTDVSHSYYLLADLYDESGESEKKQSLLTQAEKINTSMSKVIVQTLLGSGPYSGWLHCE